MSPHSRRRIARLVERWISTSDWERSRAVLHRHPELISDAADLYLATMAAKARKNADLESADVYTYHHELLRLCKETGIDAAVDAQKNVGATLADLVDAGVASLRTYRAAGHDEHLKAALANLDQAALLALPGYPDRVVILSNLGIALVDRFERGRVQADLDRSIAVLEEAVEAAHPDTAGRSAALANLGIALLAGRKLGATNRQVDQAIDVLEEAVRLADDASERGRRLGNLGVALSDRYNRDGNAADLTRAVQAYEAAIALSASGSSDYASHVANLSTALAERYALYGEPVDLDNAISRAVDAIGATAPGEQDLADRTENWALMLRDRYVRDGDLTDLDMAVQQLGAALDLTPSPGRGRPGRLDQLATTLRLQALRRGDGDELRRAVEVHRQAASLTVSPAERPVVLNNLAGSLRAWAAATGELSAMDEAVQTYEAALRSVTSPEERCSVLSNLGSGFLDRYTMGGQSSDLDEAINALTESVAGTPPRSTERPARLNNLGNGLRRRYDRNRRPSDADDATAAYRECSALTTETNLEAGLQCGLNWGRWAGQRAEWDQAKQAFDAARAVADQLVARHVTRSDKEAWLGAFPALAAQAAYSCSRTDDTDAAAGWLEWGRARIFSDALGSDRRALANLAQERADLVERYRAVSARVRSLENTPAIDARDTDPGIADHHHHSRRC